jgi:hypothetical protein
MRTIAFYVCFFSFFLALSCRTDKNNKSIALLVAEFTDEVAEDRGRGGNLCYNTIQTHKPGENALIKGGVTRVRTPFYFL